MGIRRSGPIDRCLLERHICMQVGVGGLSALVAQPESNNRNIDTYREQIHCCGVPKSMHGDVFVSQAGAVGGSCCDMFMESMFESVS